MKVQRTLGELRATLQRRLGFVAQGASATNQHPILESFLQDAQETLWFQCVLPELKREAEITVNAGQTLYDWPADFDLSKPFSVTVIDENDQHRPLAQGIEEWHDSNVANRTIPERYDIGPQLELWPEPDDTYPLRLDYYALPARFTQDSDRASVDDSAVFLLALANAKAHYRHPDAKVYAQQAETTLRALRGKQHGNRRYFRGRQEKRTMTRPGRVGD